MAVLFSLPALMVTSIFAHHVTRKIPNPKNTCHDKSLQHGYFLSLAVTPDQEEDASFEHRPEYLTATHTAWTPIVKPLTSFAENLYCLYGLLVILSPRRDLKIGGRGWVGVAGLEMPAKPPLPPLCAWGTLLLVCPTLSNRV